MTLILANGINPGRTLLESYGCFHPFIMYTLSAQTLTTPAYMQDMGLSIPLTYFSTSHFVLFFKAYKCLSRHLKYKDVAWISSSFWFFFG